MPNPIYATLTSAGTSRVVNLDYDQDVFNVSVSVTGSSSGTFTYGVEYTYDDAQGLANIGSTRAQVWFTSTATSSNASANGVANFSFPIAAVRMTSTAMSSAILTMCIMQGGPV